MSSWRPIARTPLWKRILPSFLHGPILLGIRLSIVSGIAVIGIGFVYYQLAAKFDLKKVSDYPRKNVFYDRSGLEIAAVDREGLEIAEREELPKSLIDALLAREDLRFYHHSGVDFRGLTRAFLRNVKDRTFTQGASTLSMQLARNTYDMRAKSIHRKALEIALTLRMERRYTKDEILTYYLNRIYFGAGAYGIAQAAQVYFGKHVSQLHPGESALLVGIIRGPHIFSPLRNFEASLEQRDQVIKRMIDSGMISINRADRIKNLRIELSRAGGSTSLGMSYALRQVEQELEAIMEREGLQEGGLHVFTTLDSNWQARLESQLENQLKILESEKAWEHELRAEGGDSYLQCAAASIEKETGAIMAWVGGRDYTDSRFDRNGSKRDLGGIFEPWVAAAAAERGKLVFQRAPVQTGRQIGPGEVERLARRCGIGGPFLKTEDLFRGGVAASPIELAVALATLGNGGKKPQPYFIQKITNADGNIIYHAKNSPHQVLDEDRYEGSSWRDGGNALKKPHRRPCL